MKIHDQEKSLLQWIQNKYLPPYVLFLARLLS